MSNESPADAVREALPEEELREVLSYLRREVDRREHGYLDDVERHIADLTARVAELEREVSREREYADKAAQRVIASEMKQKAAEQKAEAHARDAARYRWLKDNDQFDPYHQTDDISFALATYTGSVLDGAIDAAMQEPQP